MTSLKNYVKDKKLLKKIGWNTGKADDLLLGLLLAVVQL